MSLLPQSQARRDPEVLALAIQATAALASVHRLSRELNMTITELREYLQLVEAAKRPHGGGHG